ncbi:MAG: cupredoxin domain-containing protein, partial [Chloroflexi bacterium]|nr:cupredoxin domain-containing protein [Chloroflexota bacterium]
AQLWPPLLTAGDPTAGAGATATLLGTSKRKDGSSQVTYNGWPLHYFSRDQKPGDTTGQAVGGVWFVISSEGKQVGVAPTPTAAPAPAPTTTPVAATPTPKPTAQAREIKVSLVDFQIVPSSISVQTGEMVRFTAANNGSVPHTFTFHAGNQNVNLTLSPGQTLSSDAMSFSQSQNTSYFCEFHSSMAGSLVVAAQTPATTDSGYSY